MSKDVSENFSPETKSLTDKFYATSDRQERRKIQAQLDVHMSEKKKELADLEQHIVSTRQKKAIALKAFREYTAKGKAYLKANPDLNFDNENDKSFEPKVQINVQSKFNLKKHMTDFFNMSQGQGSQTLKTLTKTNDRAYAVGSTINVGTQQTELEARKTLFHEMAHHIEFGNEKVKLASQHFVTSRRTGDKAKLSEITGNKNYRGNEYAYPDKFIDPYVGKFYDDGCTEVLSMGVEQFASRKSMEKFMKRDRQHFIFVLGVLRG